MDSDRNEKVGRNPRKPPRKRTAAAGGAPPGGGSAAARKTVSFAGHPGSGVSTVAFHAALAWADWAKAETLLLTFDVAGCKGFQDQLGLGAGPSVLEFQDASKLVRLSPAGLGVLLLDQEAAEAGRLSRASFQGAIGRLRRDYDLFVDLGGIQRRHKLRETAFLADFLLRRSHHLFWVADPCRGETLSPRTELLDWLSALGPSPGPFDVICNHRGRCDASGEADLKPLLDLLPHSKILHVGGLPAYALSRGMADALRDEKTPELRAFMELLARIAESEEEKAAMSLSARTGIPYASWANKILVMEKAQDLDELIPRSVAARKLVLPLFREGCVLAVAMVQPGDAALQEELERLTGCEIQPFVTTRRELLVAIEDGYPPEETTVR